MCRHHVRLQVSKKQERAAQAAPVHQVRIASDGLSVRLTCLLFLIQQLLGSWQWGGLLLELLDESLICCICRATGGNVCVDPEASEQASCAGTQQRVLTFLDGSLSWIPLYAALWYSLERSILHEASLMRAAVACKGLAVKTRLEGDHICGAPEVQVCCRVPGRLEPVAIGIAAC